MADYDDEIERTTAMMDKEIDDFESSGKDDRAVEETLNTLGRMERSLLDMTARIREGARSLEGERKDKAENFTHSVDSIRRKILNTREQLRTEGLDRDGEELLKDVRSEYDAVIKRYT